MYCNKCHYHSFDHLAACPKCANNWEETRQSLNLSWMQANDFVWTFLNAKPQMVPSLTWETDDEEDQFIFEEDTGQDLTSPSQATQQDIAIVENDILNLDNLNLESQFMGEEENQDSLSSPESSIMDSLLSDSDDDLFIPGLDDVLDFETGGLFADKSDIPTKETLELTEQEPLKNAEPQQEEDTADSQLEFPELEEELLVLSNSSDELELEPEPESLSAQEMAEQSQQALEQQDLELTLEGDDSELLLGEESLEIDLADLEDMDLLDLEVENHTEPQREEAQLQNDSSEASEEGGLELAESMLESLLQPLEDEAPQEKTKPDAVASPDLELTPELDLEIIIPEIDFPKNNKS